MVRLRCLSRGELGSETKMQPTNTAQPQEPLRRRLKRKRYLRRQILLSTPKHREASLPHYLMAPSDPPSSLIDGQPSSTVSVYFKQSRLSTFGSKEKSRK